MCIAINTRANTKLQVIKHILELWASRTQLWGYWRHHTPRRLVSPNSYFFSASAIDFASSSPVDLQVFGFYKRLLVTNMLETFQYQLDAIHSVFDKVSSDGVNRSNDVRRFAVSLSPRWFQLIFPAVSRLFVEMRLRNADSVCSRRFWTILVRQSWARETILHSFVLDATSCWIFAGNIFLKYGIIPVFPAWSSNCF